MYVLMQSLDYFIQIYSWVIIAYVLLSYFPETRRSQFFQILRKLCDPLLNIFRFASFSGMSFAPFLAILFLQFVDMLLHGILNV